MTQAWLAFKPCEKLWVVPLVIFVCVGLHYSLDKLVIIIRSTSTTKFFRDIMILFRIS